MFPPLRIALSSSSYDPYPGGVEEHTRNLARVLAGRGHAVEVWTVDRGDHLGRRTVDGIGVRYLPTPLPARSPGALVRFAAASVPAWRAWSQARADFTPDVVNVQCFGPNGLYARALHARFGVPLVVSSHGETLLDDHAAFDASALLRRGLRSSCAAAGAVTACSSFVADDLARRFGARDPIVVPNGVDLDEADRLVPAPPPFDPAVPTVFAVGRFEHIKGFDLLLRAFAAADLPAEARLVIGGDGSTRAAAERLASELGIADRVSLPGRLSRSQVIASMAAASVNVVPSRMEAFGIVVLEAWRSGRPLIATSHGGPGTLVTDGVDGLTADPEDTPALARALGRLVSDPALGSALAAGGRESVRRFTWDAVADAYERLYDQAVGRRGPRSD